MIAKAACRRAAFTAAIAMIAALCAVSTAAGQDFFTQTGNLVEAEALASLSVFHPGSTGYIAVKATIKDGWHINSHEPLDKFLIPTRLLPRLPRGIEMLGVLYPEPEMAKLEVSDSEMSLFHGTVLFGVIIKIAKDTPPGEYEIANSLEYQGCNNLTCLEPGTVTAAITIRVGAMEETAEAINTDIFSSPPFVDKDGNAVRAAGEAGSGGTAGKSFGKTIEEKGLFLTFVLILLGGLALNLTPCIYPLIPITVSYFGGQAGGRTSRTFMLSLIYVLGMSITYSVLGIAAAMTGSLFGSALQNTWVILFIVAMLAGLAASMFGFWEIRMPSFLQRRTGSAKQGGWGAFFMGLTVGIVAAPCIGPFVLGLLTWVGEMGKPVMGFLMFFTLAWGMGIPFIVLATVSGSISKLPRSGNWMIWIRKFFGFILLLMALYFARHLMSAAAAAIGYVVVLVAGGLFLGWIDIVPGMGRGFARSRKIVGVMMLAAAAWILFMPGGPFGQSSGKKGIAFSPYSKEAFDAAVSGGRGIMIDFSADWCVPCHELEMITFSDPAVLSLSGKITTLKVDLTRSGEREKELKKEFGIVGVPTIIFFDASGSEVPGSRITGFVGPEVLLEKMKTIAGE
ncbi:MAG: thioredoxin family protein [Candidatus Krumholzibacteria bacterium]|nr:thioredoxin family protein [Candidatus Krumholzibacteria bacterium]